MGAHDDQVVLQFVRVCNNAPGHIVHFRFMNMKVDRYPFGEFPLRQLAEVSERLSRILQMRLAMDFTWGVPLHHMHKGDAAGEFFRQKGSGRQCRFRHFGAVQRDQEMSEHMVHPVMRVLYSR